MQFAEERYFIQRFFFKLQNNTLITHILSVKYFNNTDYCAFVIFCFNF